MVGRRSFPFGFWSLFRGFHSLLNFGIPVSYIECQGAQSVVKNSNLKLCFLRHSFLLQVRLHSKMALLHPRDVHRAPQPSRPSGETGRPVAGAGGRQPFCRAAFFFENQKGATETEEKTQKNRSFCCKNQGCFETLDPKD